jgi:hypothetical protein
MNALSQLWNQSSIFGCVYVGTPPWTTCDTTKAVPANQDNYDRNEVLNGQGIGSGGGENELCNPTNGPATTDFARMSSAPASPGCGTGEVDYPLARDVVVGMRFVSESYSASAEANKCTAPNTPVNCVMGPVVKGWKYNDPIAGPYTGTAWNGNISNSGGTSSLAFRLFCNSSNTTPITDWGQLTNGATNDVNGINLGNGTSIGAPIILYQINPNSGTFKDFAQTYAGCASRADANLQAQVNNAGDPVMQENNMDQYRVQSASDTGESACTNATNGTIGCDRTAGRMSQTIGFMSYGFYVSNSYSKSLGNQSRMANSTFAPAFVSVSNVGTYPTVRTIRNVYRKDTLRASVAGFLDWISIPDTTNTIHGLDYTTGSGYGAEISNTITTRFGFFNLASVSSPIPIGDIHDLTT